MGEDSVSSASERASLARITMAIRRATTDLRQRHPLLEHQDADNGIRFNDLGTFRRSNRYRQVERNGSAQS
jgi:hypothetical protein